MTDGADRATATLRVLLDPSDTRPSPSAEAIVVTVEAAGTLHVQHGERARRAPLPPTERARLLSGLASVVAHPDVMGMGRFWMFVEAPTGGAIIRNRDPRGELSFENVEPVPGAVRRYLLPLFEAGRRVLAGESLDGFESGLAMPIDHAKVVLRFRRGGYSIREATHQVVLFDDGRCEHWSVDEWRDWRGACLHRRTVPADQVMECRAIALGLLGVPRPRMHSGHDPTASLEVEVRDEQGVFRSVGFVWGRKRMHDGPLDPVVGEDAMARFEALNQALRRF